MTVSRNPEDYWPSNHAYNRSRQRGIDWPLVASTIKDGQLKESHKDGCKLFVEDYHFTDDPVGVVANVDSGEIITVEWRTDG